MNVQLSRVSYPIPLQKRIQLLGKGGEKHEIYAVAFGGHHFYNLFYNLFLQGRGGHGPLGYPPGSATALPSFYINYWNTNTRVMIRIKHRI